MLTKARVEEITSTSIVVTNEDGKRQTIDADNIVLATGAVPNQQLAEILKGRVKELFLIGDAVSCAVSGQKTPDGYYNLERMIRGLITKKVPISCCGTCLDARGLKAEMLVSGVERGTMSILAKWTLESGNVISF